VSTGQSEAATPVTQPHAGDEFARALASRAYAPEINPRHLAKRELELLNPLQGPARA
jgi:hypothetical protein